MNRREFLGHAGIAAGGVAGAVLAGCADKPVREPAAHIIDTEPPGKVVAIVRHPADAVASAPPARWAAGRVRAALEAQGSKVVDADRIEDAPAGATCILAAGKSNLSAVTLAGGASATLPDTPESLALVRGDVGGRKTVLAFGADPRGLSYALTEIAESVRYGYGLPSASQPPTVERPANTVRGIGRLFCSDVEDKPWYNDRGFWDRYLDMLATQRFNRFHLALGLGYDTSDRIKDSYFYFPYPFLLKAPGYDVKAKGLPDPERDNNLVMLRYVGDACVARGIDFQLGLWGHQYVFKNSPDVNYPIEGLTPETHAPYCRDALAALLKACPSVSGVTFRIHGESGIAEGSYDFWKTVMDGVVRSGRRVPIEMHAKGSDQRIIDIALATGMPVTLAPKYWAEHMGLGYIQTAIRPLELPKPDRTDQGFFAQSSGSRSFTRYGYADLLAEDRKIRVVHRMWPGTQRMLLWGDPLLAGAYGRASSFCGSDGAELFEPMSFKGRMGSGQTGGRQGYADESLKTADDWAKYRYGYVLWGRMLYNPQTQPDVWRRVLADEVGPAAAPAAEAALANAGRILPLVSTAHAQSASYTAWWVELSYNMPIVDPARRHPFGDTPSPKRFGNVSPLDPQMFARIADSAADILKGERGAKYTPAEVAAWLEGLVMRASQSCSAAADKAGRDDQRPSFRRMALDVFIQSKMGMFFAQKLRAGVLWELFEKTGEPSIAAEAVTRYKAARQAWADLAKRASGAYRQDITYGPGYFQHGHWSDRLAAIDEDISDMEARAKDKRPPDAPFNAAALVAAVLKPPARPNIGVEHTPPTSFERGKPVSIVLNLPDAPESSNKHPVPTLHYRRVNQAETFRTVTMHPSDRLPAPRSDSGHTEYLATIAGDYTDSPFPLQYYFELNTGGHDACLFPGIQWTNQPYFVIRQARAVAAG